MSGRRMRGTVKWFNAAKGFGFITGDDRRDYFVHSKDIQGSGFKSLREGQRVEFTGKQDPKGLTATAVKPIS
ncbi:hypothetical protein ACP4OV_016383 [Aristida adscensionis]